MYKADSVTASQKAVIRMVCPIWTPINSVIISFMQKGYIMVIFAKELVNLAGGVIPPAVVIQKK